MTPTAAAPGPQGEPPAGAAPFTVLMPLWRKDEPDRFEDAVRSATLAQTLRPDLLILTVDGPLPEGLEAVVARIEAGEFGPARVLRHEAHRGIALCLQDGLEASPHEIVARADADDLCRPERFAVQIPAMTTGEGLTDPVTAEGADLIGGGMQEFSDSVPPGTGPRRSRPLTHAEIVAYLPHHTPFHHPTVVLRRSTALAVGGYRDLKLLEDYWLWERMMLGGARMGNVETVVVDYRVDEQLFARRGGWVMFASDLQLQRVLLRDRVTTPRRFLINVVLRGGYRFVPGWVRGLGYRRFVEHGEQTAADQHLNAS